LAIPLAWSCANAGSGGETSDTTGTASGGANSAGGAAADGGSSVNSGTSTAQNGGNGGAGGTVETLPQIDNLSGASESHVIALVQEAIDGLGFKGSLEGPNPDDRFFVGKQYIAWLDQTGFYGKMNGLWRLDGGPGDRLDFALRDGARPLNTFIVGEHGEGKWPPGYPGAEHVEFPNSTPEANDDPTCGNTDWCNQYALNEAAPVTDPDVPWWSACNPGKALFSEKHLPVVEESINGGLKVVYEGRLVKEADGDGLYDGDDCHQDYLFDDGIRRAVYYRVGFELFADDDYVVRTMQVRNPIGNPAFTGPMSFIGGFVLTAWPSPHPLKRFDRYIRPRAKNIVDTAHALTLQAGMWNDHQLTPTAGDEVFGWLEQGFGLSHSNAHIAGQTVVMHHVGATDNGDTGFCLCSVHGGLEIGGGLLHGGIALPVPAGGVSIEARRRLALPGPVTTKVLTYEAESSPVLQHGSGVAEGDGWLAQVGKHTASHIVFGPYASDWGGQSAVAQFHLMVDNATPNDDPVVAIDLFDVTTQEDLASAIIRRKHFNQSQVYQPFRLVADMLGRKGHVMETRVWWHGQADAKIDKIVVSTY